MAATYEPIATTTLGSAASSITFSSIPSTYTDLRVVFTGQGATGGVNFDVRYNSDTGTNYSYTEVGGNGSAAQSNYNLNSAKIAITVLTQISNSLPAMVTMDIFSYAGSTYKTALAVMSADKNGSGVVDNNVSLWRSTAAINRIDIIGTTGNYATGTTATLYGITKA